MWHESNLMCWRLRKTQQLPSSSVHMHLLWWDVSLIQRAALQSLGDRSARHGWHQQSAVRGQPGQHLCLENIWTDPSLPSSWCFHLHSEWCPSAAAGRSFSVWKWASWWWPWWPAVQDRSVTAAVQARPAMVDLTCTLFWTSKCSDFHWNTAVHDSQKAAWSQNKHVHVKKKASFVAFAWEINEF